jgi:phosphohistidine phosphatase
MKKAENPGDKARPGGRPKKGQSRSSKSIILVRHARARSKESGIPDFERSLTKKGEKEARRMAKKLKKKFVWTPLWISSTANRALETAHIFAEELGFPMQKIMIKDEIYGGSSGEAILDIIRAVDDRHRSVIVFGHDPALSDSASRLLKNFKAAIPKGGILALSVPVISWRQLAMGKGEMLFFIGSATQHKEQTHFRNEIKNKIIANLTALLGQYSAGSGIRVDKLIRKRSEKLSGELVMTPGPGSGISPRDPGEN